MIRRVLLLAAMVAASVSSAHAQAPVPGTVLQPAPAAAGTAAIAGRVVAAGSGKPLIRVRVRLIASTPAPSAVSVTTSTNADGRFTLKDVAPGQYRVEASRFGYVTMQWGQRRVREAGRTVDVKPGATSDRIDIAMPKAGVIAGQVVDEYGQPYPGVRVDARDMRYIGGSSTRVPFPAGIASPTDDRGQFRITELPPGTYQIIATSAERWTGPDKRPVGYPAAAYPGVPPEQAQTIVLAVSEQRLNVNIQLFIGHPVRVTGVLQNAAGQKLAGENVQAAHAIRGSGATSTIDAVTARTAADGSFELRDVMPGDYRITGTHRGANGQAESAVTFVTVADADVNGLVLTTRTASTVTGAVVADDGSTPAFLSRLRVLLVPGDNEAVMGTVRVQPVTASGSFTLQSVGGPFLFRLSGLPDDWMIKGVTLKDDDISERAWDVPVDGGTYGPLRIEVTQTIGRATGTTVDARNAPTSDAAVVIFAEDDAEWVPGSRLVRVARPAAGGVFTVTGLPAARYLAIARDFVEDGAENDRAFLASLRQTATAFELVAGATASLTLHVTAAP